MRQRLIGIPSMQLLISTRKLRWAGHVVRMDAERLSRNKFFSSWIKDVTIRLRHSWSLHVILA